MVAEEDNQEGKDSKVYLDFLTVAHSLDGEWLHSTVSRAETRETSLLQDPVAVELAHHKTAKMAHPATEGRESN